MTAEQAKQQTALAKMEAEAKIKQLEAELEMQRMQQEFMLKAELIKMQKGIESQIKSSELQLQQEKDRYKEDRKDKRTAKQASQQSKLIQQRQQDLDPIDFDGQDTLGSGMEGIVGID